MKSLELNIKFNTKPIKRHDSIFFNYDRSIFFIIQIILNIHIILIHYFQCVSDFCVKATVKVPVN